MSILRKSVLLLSLGLIFSSCGGGGSGSGASSRAQLLEVIFPDPLNINPEPDATPPGAAPLNQQIIFRFSEVPPGEQVSNAVLAIRDLQGVPVSGTYRVQGASVVFTPSMPTAEPMPQAGATFSNGNAALQPGTSYVVRIGPATWPQFVTSVAPTLRVLYPDPADQRGVSIAFGTTSHAPHFFKGVPPRRPRLVSVSPTDGTVGVAPNLYADPEQRFLERVPFLLEFDAAVRPHRKNFNSFRLIDLDERTAEYPAGIPLGLNLEIVSNEIDRCVLSFEPSGVLPFGHLLALEVPINIRGISQSADPGPERAIVTTFTVAEAASDVVISDELVENFDSTERRNPDTAEVGLAIPALWDVNNSDVLQASFGFPWRGELGSFQPKGNGDPDNPTIIVLDTQSQSLPLLDGSTPEAPDTTVFGGIFSFTEIDIPADVEVIPRGSNPLVLTATGSVRIAGKISAKGQRGGDENAFDSGVTSIAGGQGGAGGGRGGEAHPLLWLPGTATNLLNLVSPPRGGRGWGPSNIARIGGEGGRSCELDDPDENGEFSTVREESCGEGGGRNESKPPGGGGGTFSGDSLDEQLRLIGEVPVEPYGIGNVVTDGLGNYIVRKPTSPGDETWRDAEAGLPGLPMFQDGNFDNDFIGLRGEIPWIIGGQGGGAGGSGLDSYYCGDWCQFDADPFNDAICTHEFGNPPRWAASVGDSRGGSGGGAGGGVAILSLGSILIESNGGIDCSGGDGGSGEITGCSNWAGAAGGGSGGCIIVQSAQSVTVQAEGFLNVRGGGAGRAHNSALNLSCNLSRNNIGGGGRGGDGIIQIQVPEGTQAVVDDDAVLIAKSWLDKNNNRNPVEFTDISLAVSSWFDLGRAIARPDGAPHFIFAGTDKVTGEVRTDAAGFVLNPKDIRIDYLGQEDPDRPGSFLPGEEPRANFIPPNATVVVEFQGASAISVGSKEVDVHSFTEWDADPAIAAGLQFIRYRVTFDIAANPEDSLQPGTPLPTVQRLRIRAKL